MRWGVGRGGGGVWEVGPLQWSSDEPLPLQDVLEVRRGRGGERRVGEEAAAEGK